MGFRHNLAPNGGDAARRKRFGVEQIVAALKPAEVGAPVAGSIRPFGILEQSSYRRKKWYAGLQTDPVHQRKLWQEANARLEKVAESTPCGYAGGPSSLRTARGQGDDLCKRDRKACGCTGGPAVRAA